MVNSIIKSTEIVTLKASDNNENVKVVTHRNETKK